MIVVVDPVRPIVAIDEPQGTTITTQLGPINAATLREAHGRVEGSTAIGKVVVAGW